MSFSPKCKDFSPAIIIVDGFVTVLPGTGIQSSVAPKAGKGSTPPSFQQYPAQVSTAFSKALQDSLNLIVFKTAQTPTKAAPQPLFKITHVDAIEKVNLVLGAGDVVVCFAVFPDIYGMSSLDGTFRSANPVGGDLEKVANALQQKVFDQFVNSWKIVADLKRTPPPEKDKTDTDRESDVLGIGGGGSTPLDVVLTTGTKRRTFFASRTGVIDAGSVTGVAIDNWYGDTQMAKTRDAVRRAALKQLASGAGVDQAFTPTAVVKFAAAKLPDSDQILATIGRGLGYTAVHEIWHATRGPNNRGHIPESSGRPMLSVIEAAANPSFRREGLKLLDTSISEITKEYEQTWCKFISEGRENIASLRR